MNFLPFKPGGVIEKSPRDTKIKSADKLWFLIVDYRQRIGYNINKEKVYTFSMFGLIGDGRCVAVFRLFDPLCS
jgi:hypothetical protein